MNLSLGYGTSSGDSDDLCCFWKNLFHFIKACFVEPYSKTGCRYLVVDAYNEDVPVANVL